MVHRPVLNWKLQIPNVSCQFLFCSWEFPLPLLLLPHLLPAGSLKLAAAQPAHLGLALLQQDTGSASTWSVASIIPGAILLDSPSHDCWGRELRFIPVARKNTEPSTVGQPVAAVMTLCMQWELACLRLTPPIIFVWGRPRNAKTTGGLLKP